MVLLVHSMNILNAILKKNLHSTMVLLVPEIKKEAILFIDIFTFHYGSISTRSPFAAITF